VIPREGVESSMRIIIRSGSFDPVIPREGVERVAS